MHFIVGGMIGLIIHYFLSLDPIDLGFARLALNPLPMWLYMFAISIACVGFIYLMSQD